MELSPSKSPAKCMSEGPRPRVSSLSFTSFLAFLLMSLMNEGHAGLGWKKAAPLLSRSPLPHYPREHGRTCSAKFLTYF